MRTVLKNILAFLAKFAIKKHKMEMIVILGINGTEITKELAYTILSSKFKVRRVTNKPWWDLSIPLSILGYKDVKRSPLGWIFLIARSFIYLVFGPSNTGSIIINLNFLHKDTMNFWAKIIYPDILILSSFKNDNKEVELFVQNTIKKAGRIIIHQESNFKNHYSDYKDSIYYISKEKGDFLFTSATKDNYVLNYNNESLEISKKSLSLIPLDSFELAIAIGLLKSIPLKESFYHAIKIDFGTLLQRIKTNIYKSEY